jgi:hypothetical protein
VAGFIINNEDVSNILYSNIRNKKHKYIRSKGYRKHLLRLIYSFILGNNRVNFSKSKDSILNFVSSKYYNLDILSSQFNIISSDYAATNRWLILIDILLTIAFIIEIRVIQKFLLNISLNILETQMSKYNYKSMICNHPDLLCTFIGFVFNKTNRKVITIQHGIYQLSSYRVLWFEKYLCSHIVVWGRLFKNLYAQQGIPNDKIIIGAACLTYKKNNLDLLDSRYHELKPVIIGQQLNKISDAVFYSYNSFISKLIKFYLVRGKKLSYRPHPRENVNDTLSNENIDSLIILERIDQVLFIESYNVFYSVASTLLVETFLNKKVSFQMGIEIDDLKYDEFRKYTGIPFVKESDIPKHMDAFDFSFSYDNNYLNISDSFQIYNQNCIRIVLVNKY